MTPTLYVAIGISGSGKSTFYHNLKKTIPNLNYYSWDQLRHEWYDPVDYNNAFTLACQDKNFGNKADKCLLDILNQHKSVFIDNTNLSPKRRAFAISNAKKLGYKTVAIIFNVPLTTAINRQSTRLDKSVNKKAVINQYNSLTLPTHNEFDEVYDSNNFTITEATIPELRRNLETGFPNTKKRQHSVNEVQVLAINYIPNPTQKTLYIASTTTASAANQYHQNISLSNIMFDLVDSDINIRLERNNKPFYVRPVNEENTDIMVSCNCQDYLMRFANINAENNCHIGELPPPYTKTTNRPPVNPSRVPGMCKHIIKVVDYLNATGLLV